MIESQLTSWEAAVTEVRCLAHSGQVRVLEFVRRSALDLSFPLADEIAAVARLAANYRNVRMALGDG